MSHTGLMQESVEALLKQDRDYLWHHLTQHKVFQTSEPLIMVEGQGSDPEGYPGPGVSGRHVGRGLVRQCGLRTGFHRRRRLRAVEEDALLCGHGGKHSHDPVCPQGDFAFAETGQGLLLQQRLGGEREGLQDGSTVFPFEIQR